ncbi:MAG: GNAT family N-acetyltransferase [Anaerolineaceae bacterium]|nr:GNAT family N-acetyltransferase [Anaerolineaceae bacterium]
MTNEGIIRLAERADRPAITALLNESARIHRHLDWRHPLDWLGKQPFVIWEINQQIVAALACTPDPENVAWIRLFTAANYLSPQRAWTTLFPTCIETLKNDPHLPTIAAVSLQSWFEDLLKRNGFFHRQDIIVLAWNGRMPPEKTRPANLVIRGIEFDDLPEIARVDRASFEDIWQHSDMGVEIAYYHAEYGTVAVLDGKIVGYQISTWSETSAHLARLAVTPDVQRNSIGHHLVADLLRYFYEIKPDRITVNTQSDNMASQALYKTLNFELQNEFYPVYVLKDY